MADEVVIISTQEILVVTEEVAGEVVETVGQGPQGAKGDRGEVGPPGSSLVFQVPVAATVWTINHNLETRPGATCFTVGGMEIEGTIQHLSDNVLTITFLLPVAGYARIN